MRKSLLRSSIALSVLCAAAGPVFADTAVSPPQGVVGLSASASVEITKDLLSVTLSTTREGSDAASVQAQLKQALDSALAEARKVVKPGQLEVQTGNFSLYPRYAPKGGLVGWQGSAELIVEGRDMPAIGALTGRITTLAIARVAYGLSRELRERAEGELAAQAIGRFRAKAADYARQFGYGSYVIREVSVNAESPVTTAAAPMMSAKAMAAPMDESLPVEAGKGAVTANVNGTVQLVK